MKKISFLCTLFDLWMNDFVNGAPKTSIRFFDSVFYKYVGLTPPECTLLDECGTYLVIEHNGDVYACDFFVEPQWRLGNIKKGHLKDMLNSKKQAVFGKIKKNLSNECKECQWLNYCSGGCPKDRLKDPNHDGASYLCAAYKRFFEHADFQLASLASEWRSTNAPPANEEIKKDIERNKKYKISRNAPCPCGSGLKYKKCCLSRKY